MFIAHDGMCTALSLRTRSPAGAVVPVAKSADMSVLWYPGQHVHIPYLRPLTGHPTRIVARDARYLYLRLLPRNVCVLDCSNKLRDAQITLTRGSLLRLWTADPWPAVCRINMYGGSRIMLGHTGGDNTLNIVGCWLCDARASSERDAVRFLAWRAVHCKSWLLRKIADNITVVTD